MDFAFFVAKENFPFGVAMALFGGISIVEGIGLLVGLDLAGPLDDFLPDFDISADGQPPSPVGACLGWLHLGKVPFLILLVLFLFGFGVSGYLLQYAAAQLLGSPLSAAIASLPALALALLFLRYGGGLTGRFLKEESTAVSRDTLVGKVAVITLGRATPGNPTQAKLKDEHGQTHYVMVEPFNEKDILEPGQQVLLIERSGTVFQATPFEI